MISGIDARARLSRSCSQEHAALLGASINWRGPFSGVTGIRRMASYSILGYTLYLGPSMRGNYQVPFKAYAVI